MASIIKSNTYADFNGREILTANNQGALTTQKIMYPAFLATRTTTQNVDDSTYTIVNFDNVSFDTDSGYSTSTYKYTVPTSGKYFIFSYVRGGAPGTDDLERFYLRLMKNSDTRLSEVFYDQRSNGGYIFTNTLTDIQDLSTGDTIYMHALVDVTTGQAGISGATNRTITAFGAYRIGS